VILRISAAIVVCACELARADSPACPPPHTPASQHAAEEIATGKSLFAKALALQNAGKTDAACDMFESSLRLDPQIGTRLNVAACRENQGRLVEARAMFQEAVEEATRVGDRRATFALQRAQALDTKLVHITIRVAEPETAGLLVKVGACPRTDIAATMLQVAMPGTIAIDVTAPGRKEFHVERDAAAGSELAIDVPALTPDMFAENERKAKEAEVLAAIERRKAEQLAIERELAKRYDRHPLRRWMFVTGGLGAASLVTGSAFAIGARRAQSAFDAASCGDRTQLLGSSAYASCASERDRGQRDALFANGFMIGGGALVAASVIVFVVDPGNVERPDSARPRISVSPTHIDLVIAW
jgi:hypothetical protein